MPDWSYSTLLQPVFQRLPHDWGRRFVNRFLGRLGGLPGGPKVIDLMGHMSPPKELQTSFLGLQLCSPVILAPAIDPEGQASRAFARFGFGALVVGPISLAGVKPLECRQTSMGTLVGSGGAALTLDQIPKVGARRGSGPLFAELALDLGDPHLSRQCEAAFSALQGHFQAAIVSPQTFPARSNTVDFEALRQVREAAGRHGLPLLLGMPESVTVEVGLAWAQACATLDVGLYISGHPNDGEWEWGGALALTAALVGDIKRALPHLPVAADSGALSPVDALELVRAGADLVVVSAGLVHTGPGLAKRINDALLLEREQAPHRQPEGRPTERSAWFWGMLLGLSMLIGAGLAGWVALTDVVLPYDEEFCGKTGAEIAAFNPKILSFMTHDRITLSGTMVSLGVLYVALSWFEIRRGSHWAQRTIQVSAAAGFFSFFAFLGYGYFDPFHAMVAAMLSQITIQVMVLPTGPLQRRGPSESFCNDRAWRRGMWGQLLFVAHGGALILAGVVILCYGVSEVFVPQDIEYLGMDAQRLALFDPQLKALIAHDRATFGGMLVSAGLALLLTTLWGFRRGEGWLWWVYLVVISEPYLQTLWIHYSIGYRSHFHLAPVYIGIVLLLAGLACSREYLTGPHA